MATTREHHPFHHDAEILQPDDALISRLPRDLLLHILGKLPVRDAVRAGVLSRQWRRLPGQLPSLLLAMEDILPASVNKGAVSHKIEYLSDVLLEAATAVLASRAAGDGEMVPVRSLATRFMLRHCYMAIGRLIDDAVASGKVLTVELELSTGYKLTSSSDHHGNMEGFPRSFGGRLRLLFVSCRSMFGGLTRLQLSMIRLPLHGLDAMVRVCTKLEFLHVKNFNTGSQRPWQLRHAQLTELQIEGSCQRVDLDWLPKLRSFTLRRWSAPELSFGHVPCLSEVTLSNIWRVDQPTLKLSQLLANTAVTDLSLDFEDKNVWVEPEEPGRLSRIFDKLERLEIRNIHGERYLLWSIFLLQAAPHLADLHVTLERHDHDECKPAMPQSNSADDVLPLEAAPTGFQHEEKKKKNLVRLTVTGQLDKSAPHVHRIIDDAANLKKMLRLHREAGCNACRLLRFDTLCAMPWIAYPGV